MHTFDKDGFSVTYNSDLAGEIYLGEEGFQLAMKFPPGFLQAWLSHAGYELVPKGQVITLSVLPCSVTHYYDDCPQFRKGDVVQTTFGTEHPPYVCPECMRRLNNHVQGITRGG